MNAIPDWAQTALIFAYIGAAFLFPWLLAARIVQLIKSPRWKWILAFFFLLIIAPLLHRWLTVPHAGLAFLLIYFVFLIETSLFLLFFCLLIGTLLRAFNPLRGKWVLAGVFGFLALTNGYFYATGIIGNTVARVQLDHGITPPRSVSHIDCHGLFSLDRCDDTGAAASFEIDRADLPALLAQLDLEPPDPTLTPAISPSQRFKKVINSYFGGSCTVSTYDVDADHVGIYIETEW